MLTQLIFIKKLTINNRIPFPTFYYIISYGVPGMKKHRI